MNRKNKKIDSSITILLVLGIFIVVNFLSYQIFFRWDVTQNNDYSISTATKETASNLDDIVNIKVYFSKNLPSQYINLEQEVGDVLDEYTNYSNGKIKVEFIDPETVEGGQQKMLQMGIPPLQFNVLEKDNFQTIIGYLGIILEYGSNQEVIPVVDSTNNLEYQVTLAIKKLTSEDMATIGIVTSNGCKDLSSEVTSFSQAIQELYKTEAVDLETETEIPSDIDTLIILGPTEIFNEDQLKAVDKFLMQDKNLLIALDGISIETGLVPVVNETGLENLLDKYGIKVNQNLVLDASASLASFSQGYVTFTTSYPFWPKIDQNGLNQDSNAVANLETLVFPWVSSVEGTDSDQVSYLVSSSEKSWLQTGNFDLDPQQSFNSTSGFSAYNLALLKESNFTSAYDQGDTDNAKIIVIGDSDFILDNFVNQFSDNLTLMQNLVDTLSLDDALINIRSKGVTDRPIKELSDKAKLSIRYANVFGLTIIVIIFGVVRYYLRKRSKFIDQL